MPTLADVRAFWDRNPLFTGESDAPVASRAFFDHHNRVYVEDCFAGHMDPRLFPDDLSGPILDLGCGIGFWLEELWGRGARNLTGADLSPRSLEIARTRCEMGGIAADLREANAEALPFAASSFAHVNCQGVIHHTPEPRRAVAEIARVLRPGGTATISVYYRNALLRSWPVIRTVMRAVPIGLAGRGRERLSSVRDADEIVRLYDGAANPIGLSYSRAGFVDLLAPLRAEAIFFHYFPARALPFSLPAAAHRFLDRTLPFMIFARARKTAA